jgi:hypothetical protein
MLCTHTFIWRLTGPLIVLLGIVACSGTRSPDQSTAQETIDLPAVAAFLSGLDEGIRVELTAEGPSATDRDRRRHTLRWLRRELPIPEAEHDFKLILTRSSLADRSAYALRRGVELGLGLADDRTYVQVRYIPDGLACPEFHGVIDQRGPTLLLFWSEGG